jgi:hypothetical protein
MICAAFISGIFRSLAVCSYPLEFHRGVSAGAALVAASASVAFRRIDSWADYKLPLPPLDELNKPKQTRAKTGWRPHKPLMSMKKVSFFADTNLFLALSSVE